MSLREEPLFLEIPSYRIENFSHFSESFSSFPSKLSIFSRVSLQVTPVEHEQGQDLLIPSVGNLINYLVICVQDSI